MIWSYGITTVPERRDEYLRRTVDSLYWGGFRRPRLFVDDGPGNDYSRFELPVTYRTPKISPWANWLLALWELYLREPTAHRFALFQDDVVTYRNLREYLEQTRWPGKGYLNLYTFPPPRQLSLPETVGWHHSNQLGRGALALVFDRDGIQALLGAKFIVLKCTDASPKRSVKSIDGGVIGAMKQVGFCEYVHQPSLVQHIGDRSTVNECRWETAPTFRGEEFDALDLLKERPDE